MELFVFLNYMNCCSLSVVLGRGVLIPPSCLDSFSLSYSPAPELPAICYAGWKTERKIKLRGGWQEGGRNKQIRQTHWNNSSDLILHRWLEEARRLCFVSSCFSHVWFFLSCRSPPFSPRILHWQGLQWQRLERVIWIHSNMQRCTVLQDASLLNL